MLLRDTRVRVHYERLRHHLRRIGFGSFGLWALLALVNPRLPPPYDAVVAISSVVLLFTPLLSLLGVVVLPHVKVEQEGSVQLETDTLVLPDDLGPIRIPREEVVGGWIESAGDAHTTARIKLQNHEEYSISTTEKNALQELLEKLGVGATQQHFTATLGRPARAGVTHAIFLVLGALLGVAAGFEFGLTVVLAALLGAVGGSLFFRALAALLRPPSVTVGREGIQLRFSIWQFVIPFRKLRSVRLEHHFIDTDHYFVFEMTNGKIEKFHASADRSSLETLLQRITEAHTAFQQSEGSVSSNALEAQGRSIADWRTGLRVLVENNPTYRGDVFDGSRLLQILRDDSVPAEQRVGAAMALMHANKSFSRDILEVARGCASEVLRHTLQLIAEGDAPDEELQQQLNALREQRVL